MIFCSYFGRTAGHEEKGFNFLQQSINRDPWRAKLASTDDDINDILTLSTSVY
jgi:hypothetical protein